MKLCVLGGGSTYTPELMDGLIKKRDKIFFDEVYLMDINEENLKVVSNFIRRMFKKHGLETKVVDTTDAEEAIEESDFVVTQIRVGGIRGRIIDEKVPLKYGVIGQETTGPGGFAFALRAIPVLVDYARKVAKLAPNSWLINFSNP